MNIKFDSVSLKIEGHSQMFVVGAVWYQKLAHLILQRKNVEIRP